MSNHEPPPATRIRYRFGPLVGLVALGLVPVLGLSALLIWSDQQADAHEAAAAAAVPAPEVSDLPPSRALTTPVFSVRRTPATLARIGADNRLAASMEQLAGFVDAASCMAVSVDGRAVGSWHGDVAVIPASTHKLLTAGAATEVLGADHRFTTSVTAAPPVDGVVDGDIYLIGGGDPLLVASGLPPDDDGPSAAVTTPLDQLADAVVAAGITSISGSVVGDGTRFDGEYVNAAWGPGVAFVEAGPIGGLLVSDGRVVGRSGRQRDPAEAAAREFARLLRDRGVSVSNGWKPGVADPAAPVIATVESAPLSEIVADMLTRSDNDTAEMLLKEIGVTAAAEGTAEAGLRVLSMTLESWGVAVDDVVVVDGSGLSPDNRLTCDVLMTVLNHLAPTTVVDGLPLAGRSGTLIDQFLGTPVEGRLVAKTGTLTNPPLDSGPPEVKALAGYLDAPNGDLIEFSLVLNGAGVVTADGYVAYWGALAERLAAYPAGPASSELGPR